MKKIQADARSLARKYDIPEDIFLALIEAESGWNPGALSRRGAIGLTQVMPETARKMGYDPDHLKEDPVSQLEAGARYLLNMYREFGNWVHAVAAYNAGPVNVTKFGGVPPFKETRRYVEKVFKNAQQYRDR